MKLLKIEPNNNKKKWITKIDCQAVLRATYQFEVMKLK